MRMTEMTEARRDPALGARVIRSVPLYYDDGADPALDRPAHVRSGSGLARVGGRLAVVQDDAAFIALVDPATLRVDSITLPAGEGGVRQFDDLRGNKRFKLDLESCTTLRGEGGREMLVAFGSGSAPPREAVVVIEGLDSGDAEVRVIPAAVLYAQLHAERAFSGSELNVEGVAVVPGALRLFNRGNGAPKDGLRPVDATCDLDLPAFLAWLRAPETTEPPAPANVTQYDLGGVGGVRLTFTDAETVGDAILFSSGAEDSPDAVQDGPVAGTAIGVIDAGGARWALVVDDAGRPFAGKIEGISTGAPGRLWAVADPDDPIRATHLLELELTGPWPAWP
jgi:hypothetical protein